MNMKGKKEDKKVFDFSDAVWFEFLNLNGDKVEFYLKDLTQDTLLLNSHIIYLHVLYKPI